MRDVGLPEEDRPRVAHARHHCRVAPGHEVNALLETGCADQAFNLDPVFHRERHTVQRTDGVAPRDRLVGCCGPSEGVWRELHDGVQHRVHLGDAIEVGADHLGGRRHAFTNQPRQLDRGRG